MDAPDCRHCPHSEKSGQHHRPHGPESGDYRRRPGPRPARYGSLCCDKERRLYGDENHASFDGKKQYIGRKARWRPRPRRPLHTAILSAALRRLGERSERTAAVRRRSERYCREWDTQNRSSLYPAGRGQRTSRRDGSSRDRCQLQYRHKARPGRSTVNRTAAATPEAGARQRGTGTPGSAEGRSEIFCTSRPRGRNADRTKPVRWGRQHKRPRCGSSRRRCSRAAGSTTASANSSCTTQRTVPDRPGFGKWKAGNGRIPEIVCRTYDFRDSYWLSFGRAFQYPNQHTADAGSEAHSPRRDAKDFPAARYSRCGGERTPFVRYGRNAQDFQLRTAARQ